MAELCAVCDVEGDGDVVAFVIGEGGQASGAECAASVDVDAFCAFVTQTSHGHGIDAQFLEVFEAGAEARALGSVNRQANGVVSCKAEAIGQQTSGLVLGELDAVFCDEIKCAVDFDAIGLNGIDVGFECGVAAEQVVQFGITEGEVDVVDAQGRQVDVVHTSEVSQLGSLACAIDVQCDVNVIAAQEAGNATRQVERAV